jgi:hypothetical protein
MKKSLLIVTCFVLTLSACTLTPEQKAAKEKAKYDSIMIALKVQKEVDSMINAKANTTDEKDANQITSSIAIIKYYTSSPNSAGGVDANIVWKNKSDKTVKYARFTAAPYNAVDDMVTSEIGGETYKRMKATGPIKPGATDGYGTTWECLWYNSTITHMKITGIELEYMDGTIISTNNESIITQVLPKKK